MNDGYTPPYSGTVEELSAQRTQARNWFLDQCEAAVQDFEDEEVRKTALARITEAREDDTLRFDYYCGVGFTRSHSYGSKRRSFHFRAGLTDTGYSAQTLMLRKDGTLNTELLRNALWRKASREVSQRKSQEVLKLNMAQLEALNLEVPKNFNVVESEKQIGVANVSFNNYQIVIRSVSVPISELPTWMDTVAGLVRSLDSEVTEARAKVQALLQFVAE